MFQRYQICVNCKKVMHVLDDEQFVCFRKFIGKEEMDKRAVWNLCPDCGLKVGLR